MNQRSVLFNFLTIFIVIIFSLHEKIDAKSSKYALDTIPWSEDTIRINGTFLFVKTMGQGEPLLIVHGGPGLSHDYFLPHMEPWADKYKLIFYDQRASGRSSINLDSAQMSLAMQVNDIEELRKHFGIKKINLVGHSWGGILAAVYAEKYPRNIRSIVFMNCSPLSSRMRDVMANNMKDLMASDDKLHLQKIMRSDEYKAGDPKEIERVYWVTFKSSFFNQKLVYKLRLNLPAHFMATQRLLGYMYKDMAKYDFYPALKKIKAPCLIVHGSADTLPIECSTSLHDGLKNSTMVTIPQCGHFPFVEKPVELLKQVSSFYDKVLLKK